MSENSHGNGAGSLVLADAPQPVLAERPGGGKLVAQRGLFAGPSDLVSKDLYCDVAGVVTRHRTRLMLGESSRASCNTYFGRFPASYWQRWTSVRTVTLELTVTGTGTLCIGASDVHGSARRVAARAIEDAVIAPISFSVRLDKFFDGGALWLDAETEGGQRLTIEAARWTVEVPEAIRPTAVSICTMNRADDCLENLQVLAGDLDSLETLDVIYVADQGTDTVDSRPGFEQVAKDLRGKLRYIKQPNLGGAGGFTRGLYEVASHTETEHANVLFMDDDVRLEPDVIIRLTAFANRATKPIIVGGQMLNLLHPHRLHRGAEYANFDRLEPAVPATHALACADLLGVDPWSDKPQRQERRVDAGHNAWWSCLIPYEVVKAVGYPMPFFFQFDDVEYAYRARAHGFRTVTLPGAGVWHADFEWKDFDGWHRYFNLRNSIITAALHTSFDLKSILRVLGSHLVYFLMGMQYGQAVTLLKAVEDFLEGPDVLRDGGAAALREIQALRARYPETKRRELDELPGIEANEVSIINAGPHPSKPRAVLAKRLLWRALGKDAHSVGAIPADEAHWWHVALFTTAVVTDAAQDGVRIRSYDRARVLELAKRGARVLNRLRKDGHTVREQYRRAAPDLTSRDNWTRLYGL
ncbi:MAG: glycosyltransferase [Haloechinothrix sp.]